jgi:hypothetical protein
MLSKKYFLAGGPHFSAPPVRPTRAEASRQHRSNSDSPERARRGRSRLHSGHHKAERQLHHRATSVDACRSSRSVPAGAAFGLAIPAQPRSSRQRSCLRGPANAKTLRGMACGGTRPASPAFSSGGSFTPKSRPVRKAAGRSHMGHERPDWPPSTMAASPQRPDILGESCGDRLGPKGDVPPWHECKWLKPISEVRDTHRRAV